MIKHHK